MSYNICLRNALLTLTDVNATLLEVSHLDFVIWQVNKRTKLFDISQIIAVPVSINISKGVSLLCHISKTPFILFSHA